MAYTFTASDNKLAQRDDGAFIPWDTTANLGPSDKASSVYRRWQSEGSPVPLAFIAPALTPEQIARQVLLNNVNRQNIVAAIEAADPATIDIAITNYINNNVTDLASAKVMLIRLALLVAIVIRR